MTTHHAPCVCDDTEAEALRALIGSGVGQWDASRLLWGPTAVRTCVRLQLVGRIGWLRWNEIPAC